MSSGSSSSKNPRCEVRQSKVHKQGLFATERLSRGSLILAETPLVLLRDQGDNYKVVWAAFQRLDTSLQEGWMKLDHKDNEILELRLAKYAGKAGSLDDMLSCGQAMAKYFNNTFLEPIRTTAALTKLASRMNHSCKPNASWVINDRTQKFEVRALSTIERDAEIYVTYVGTGHERAYRQKRLQNWGFTCQCDLCDDPLSDAELTMTKIAEVDSNIRVVVTLSSPQSLNKHIELFAQRYDFEIMLDCTTFDAMTTATIISEFHKQNGDAAQAEDWHQKAQKMATICYGEDYKLTDEWKEQVAKTLCGPHEQDFKKMITEKL